MNVLLPFGLLTSAPLQPSAELRAVLRQAFGYPALRQYLTHPGARPLVFRYDARPVYQNRPLSRPTFDVPLPGQPTICYAAAPQDSLDKRNVFIVVRELRIDRDPAVVRQLIPYEGVVGRFRLGKGPKGEWRVRKAEVVEQ
ncbi:hypothetical protein LJY25_11660 [Hymenobacter sp. BT175]|uniref:hypothetical protein n=1 Tax=Hymenobacter translucens TaxID=2886507 RepID=UPI001D0F303A|nr:hypothetical protein [Hymenobacter translucens]MCC2547106.1 hypothetical protein [Hymenobacter translucens]